MREHVYRRVHVRSILQAVLCGRKSLAIAISALLVFFTVLALRPSSEVWHTPIKWIQSLKVHPHACPDNLNWLNELDLTYPIEYARREIIVRPDPKVKREKIKRIHESLLPELQNIDVLEDATAQHRRCIPPLVLDVPAFPYDSANASHVLFGLSTSLPGLEEALPYFQRWLPHTDARLLGIIVEEDHNETKDSSLPEAHEIQALQSRIQGLGMNAQLQSPTVQGLDSSLHALSLVKTLYESREENSQWIAIIDKDTFFPSVPALVSMLSKYNAQEEYYIGGLPEGWAQVMHFGLVGHIGAGIFISIPLAAVITEGYEHCSKIPNMTLGNVLMARCINELSETRLTFQRRLHLLDIPGDLSGFFESGRLPLTIFNQELHRSDEPVDILMTHQVADVCHECFLQRWHFDDELVLANGYSISRYREDLLRETRLDRPEQTWEDVPTIERSHNLGVDHDLGPTRPRLRLNEEKFQYRLVQSKAIDGGVRQAYHHRGIDQEPDGLLELFWREP